MPTKAYLMLKVKTGKSQGVLKVLRDVEGVEQAHACFGQPDIFGLIHAEDEKALAQVIMTKVHSIPGVEETDTHIVAHE